MKYRPLGATGLDVSAISFGAGPVSGLMTSADLRRQAEVLERALDSGMNWIDTAATYGNGKSEQGLGEALTSLGAHDKVHVATKVRLMPEHLDDIAGNIRASVAESFTRLQRPRVTLLQLHNSITSKRGDEPTSLTPLDVLGRGGVLETFFKLRDEGLVDYFGLTGIGQPEAMREVIASGQFATIQTPYHLLNPSSGETMPPGFGETNFGNVIAACVDQRMGVLAIRVFAAGALLGNAPSDHTKITKFFPLDLYERDVRTSQRLYEQLSPGIEMQELALRFVLSHPGVASAIVGLGEPAHVDAAVRAMSNGPLPVEMLKRIRDFRGQQF